MKKLVTAALTAVTAVIAGSAIALTPAHAQEVPPGETTGTPQATATPQAPSSRSQATMENVMKPPCADYTLWNSPR